MIVEKNVDSVLKKKLIVPRYQRGYAWRSEHVDDFWDDLINLVGKENQQHFFGVMYLEDDTNKSKILDGQQRITTVTLFVWAAQKYLQKKLKNKYYAQKLDEFLFNYPLNLTLGKINNDFFHNLLNNKLNGKSPDTDSNKLLLNAYEKLYGHIKKYDKLHGVDKLIRLVHLLINNFIVYVISSNSSSAKMFNLINNRGITLSEHELIRSHIFAELEKDENVDDKLVDKIDNQWHEITKNIRKATNYNLNIFFQHILNLDSKNLMEKENSKFNEKPIIKEKDI